MGSGMMDINTSMNFFSLPWRELPGALPEDIEVFMFGDVHGQADLLDAALDSIRKTPKAAASRHLIFLGDLIDNGPKSIASVRSAVDGRSKAAADRVDILPGNHDLMLLAALESEEKLDKWLLNGGKTVLAEVGLSWPETTWPEIVKKVRGQIPSTYLHGIAKGATHVRVGDLICVHAGINPYMDQSAFLSQPRHDLDSDNHWATIRYPFLDWTGGWDREDPDPARQLAKPTVIIHGHTPALRHDLTSADELLVCDGIQDYRTVDLDIGAGHRPQLAWGQLRLADGMSQLKVHAVTMS